MSTSDTTTTSTAGESSQLYHFTKTEWPVIRALRSKHPELLTQEDIARLTGDKPALRTIARVLPRLRKSGIVVQPKGLRSGWGLSDAGFKATGQGG